MAYLTQKQALNEHNIDADAFEKARLAGGWIEPGFSDNEGNVVYIVPDEELEELKAASKNTAPDSLNAFIENGGVVTDTKEGPKVKADLQNWVAILKAEYGDALVSDEVDVTATQPIKIWDDSKNEAHNLPAYSVLLMMAAKKYHLTESNASTKNLETALDYLANQSPEEGGARVINSVKIRLEKYRTQWDGQSRMADVFKKTLGSKLDSQTLEAIARSWFKGLAYNLTREGGQPYPISLDIIGEAQGIGKSLFADVLKTMLVNPNGGDLEKSGLALDLNDPMNSYSQLAAAVVANDDEMRTTIASRLKSGKNSDPNATLKNIMQTSSLTWQPKHSNETKTAYLRVIWIRTTNGSKSYDDSLSSELERRHMPIDANPHPKLNLEEYKEYIAQVLGEAFQILQDEGFDISKDTLIPDSVQSVILALQLQGSDRTDLYDTVEDIGDFVSDWDIFSLPKNDARDILTMRQGVNRRRIASKGAAMRVRDMYVVNAATILEVMNATNAFKVSRGQMEAVIRIWLKDNGFQKVESNSIYHNGVRFRHSQLWFNPNNGQTQNQVESAQIEILKQLVDAFNNGQRFEDDVNREEFNELKVTLSRKLGFNI